MMKSVLDESNQLNNQLHADQDRMHRLKMQLEMSSRQYDTIKRLMIAHCEDHEQRLMILKEKWDSLAHDYKAFRIVADQEEAQYAQDYSNITRKLAESETKLSLAMATRAQLDERTASAQAERNLLHHKRAELQEKIARAKIESNTLWTELERREASEKGLDSEQATVMAVIGKQQAEVNLLKGIHFELQAQLASLEVARWHKQLAQTSRASMNVPVMISRASQCDINVHGGPGGRTAVKAKIVSYPTSTMMTPAHANQQHANQQTSNNKFASQSGRLTPAGTKGSVSPDPPGRATSPGLHQQQQQYQKQHPFPPLPSARGLGSPAFGSTPFPPPKPAPAPAAGAAAGAAGGRPSLWPGSARGPGRGSVVAAGAGAEGSGTAVIGAPSARGKASALHHLDQDSEDSENADDHTYSDNNADASNEATDATYSSSFDAATSDASSSSSSSSSFNRAMKPQRVSIAVDEDAIASVLSPVTSNGSSSDDAATRGTGQGEDMNALFTQQRPRVGISPLANELPGGRSNPSSTSTKGRAGASGGITDGTFTATAADAASAGVGAGETGQYIPNVPKSSGARSGLLSGLSSISFAAAPAATGMEGDVDGTMFAGSGGTSDDYHHAQSPGLAGASFLPTVLSYDNEDRAVNGDDDGSKPIVRQLSGTTAQAGNVSTSTTPTTTQGTTTSTTASSTGSIDSTPITASGSSTGVAPLSPSLSLNNLLLATTVPSQPSQVIHSSSSSASLSTSSSSSSLSSTGEHDQSSSLIDTSSSNRPTASLSLRPSKHQPASVSRVETGTKKQQQQSTGFLRFFKHGKLLAPLPSLLEGETEDLFSTGNPFSRTGRGRKSAAASPGSGSPIRGGSPIGGGGAGDESFRQGPGSSMGGVGGGGTGGGRGRGGSRTSSAMGVRFDDEDEPAEWAEGVAGYDGGDRGRGRWRTSTGDVAVEGHDQYSDDDEEDGYDDENDDDGESYYYDEDDSGAAYQGQRRQRRQKRRRRRQQQQQQRPASHIAVLKSMLVRRAPHQQVLEMLDRSKRLLAAESRAIAERIMKKKMAARQRVQTAAMESASEQAAREQLPVYVPKAANVIVTGAFDAKEGAIGGKSLVPTAGLPQPPSSSSSSSSSAAASHRSSGHNIFNNSSSKAGALQRRSTLSSHVDSRPMTTTGAVPLSSPSASSASSMIQGNDTYEGSEMPLAHPISSNQRRGSAAAGANASSTSMWGGNQQHGSSYANLRVFSSPSPTFSPSPPLDPASSPYQDEHSLAATPRTRARASRTPAHASSTSTSSSHHPSSALPQSSSTKSSASAVQDSNNMWQQRRGSASSIPSSDIGPRPRTTAGPAHPPIPSTAGTSTRPTVGGGGGGGRGGVGGGGNMPAHPITRQAEEAAALLSAFESAPEETVGFTERVRALLSRVAPASTQVIGGGSGDHRPRTSTGLGAGLHRKSFDSGEMGSSASSAAAALVRLASLPAPTTSALNPAQELPPGLELKHALGTTAAASSTFTSVTAPKASLDPATVAALASLKEQLEQPASATYARSNSFSRAPHLPSIKSPMLSSTTRPSYLTQHQLHQQQQQQQQQSSAFALPPTALRRALVKQGAALQTVAVKRTGAGTTTSSSTSTPSSSASTSATVGSAGAVVRNQP